MALRRLGELGKVYADGEVIIDLECRHQAEAHEQARNILAGAGEAMISVHRALLTEELKRLADS